MREFSGSVAVRCMGWRLLPWCLGYGCGAWAAWRLVLSVTTSREGNGGCLIETSLY